MLTDTKLRNLKPKSKLYKAFDRDGMYVTVSSTGTVTFRYDYRLNGRRETLTIGRYGPTGISLAMAREKLLDAKRMVALGKSPSLEKQRAKRRLNAAKNFGETLTKWLAGARMADSTRAMRKSIIDRDILPVFENRLLTEITPDDLRALCAKVKARGAPATAVHIRDIVKQVYAFAILHGEKVENPADDVKSSSIATFVPKDRALSPTEIRLAFHQLETIAAYPTIKLALRLVLLTLVRKSELIEATWDEVDFENATWTISKERMKGRNPHVVYLSRQALDIFVALHTCAAGSRYVLPSRYDIYRCMSHATLNRITQLIASRAKEAGLPLEPFTVHDLRRTGSTLLNEVGFNGDWIEKCLAHEDGRSSRSVYNKAEYAEQRRHMLQEWADMIDAWIDGRTHVPKLLPDRVAVPVLSATV
ncbi:tyrosine-type recombinase/integrase [Pseudomonas aeruginosa]|uniref:tyrosine-type recombinase/integrase n=1 Tax=Pseudomonas aeruginosa TaxID=287 RepID=UPI000F543617|nr:tyrosine-type recombinase/integrase [Pseudomonas aeruginosa]MBH4233328.1 tyrosine-type recombinase/integrase [Pseudomonas aeruginosa]MDU0578582.1 tyrosine-type recombinase/integrase [Pseudomonas aeruginosa]MDU0717221.1 tyrosine-type recombinase/integrase [Pseudomonas aeruginosa]RPT56623.1 integrase [Pseudomonas aeruginosa]HCF1165007.1 tyrosine-type recombinase/integrase [Pseudomonas aeruginosa]